MSETIPKPWYSTEWFRLVAGIVLGVVLSLLARVGITPAPIPELPALKQDVDHLKAEMQSLKTGK